MTPGTFYAEDNSGDNITGGWSTSPTNEINWQLEGNYTIYSANFMNYLRSDPTAIRTRLDIVQSVVANVVNSVNGINIGLMRFSQNQEGGMISSAMEDITTARPGFIAALNAYTPSGPTPLTEVLWEAMRYYRGALRRGQPGVRLDALQAETLAPARGAKRWTTALPPHPDQAYLLRRPAVTTSRRFSFSASATA